MSAEGTVSCTTTATTLVTPYDYQDIQFKNEGTATVYLSFNSNVTADETSTGGWPLAPGEEWNPGERTSNNGSTETWYGITAEGTANVVYSVR